MSVAPAAISTGGLRNILFFSSFSLLLFVANSQRRRNTKVSYSTYLNIFLVVVLKVERK